MQRKDIPLGRGRSERVCRCCGVTFWVYNALLRKGGGLFCSRSCARRRPARDGDRKQARSAVGHAVAAGQLPHPGTVPCTDCGRMWEPGHARHSYDHYLGYGAAHHLHVQAVCSICHREREVTRGLYQHLPGLWERNRAAGQQACAICGRAKPPYRQGRCDRCRNYFRTHGVERPSRSNLPGRR